MNTAKERIRFGRVIAFGVLAELATMLVIVVTLTIHSRVIAAGQSQDVIDDFARQVPAVLGPLGGILFTLVAAILATRPLADRIREHGAWVGVVSAAITLPMLIASTEADRPLYLAAIALKLVAGVMGGALSERRHHASSVPA
jgi:hypothetical protein